MIPESLLAEANQDKTEEQCCTLEFLCYPSPWPSRLPLTNEYQLITEKIFRSGKTIEIKHIISNL